MKRVAYSQRVFRRLPWTAGALAAFVLATPVQAAYDCELTGRQAQTLCCCGTDPAAGCSRGGGCSDAQSAASDCCDARLQDGPVLAAPAHVQAPALLLLGSPVWVPCGRTRAGSVHPRPVDARVDRPAEGTYGPPLYLTTRRLRA